MPLNIRSLDSLFKWDELKNMSKGTEQKDAEKLKQMKIIN